MNPNESGRIDELNPVPRMRGDEPENVYPRKERADLSPHTRG